MKKIFLIIIMLLALASCHRSTFKLTYVDMNFPNDTIESQYRVTYLFEAYSANVNTTVKNGNEEWTLFLFQKKIIHTSNKPINLLKLEKIKK